MSADRDRVMFIRGKFRVMRRTTWLKFQPGVSLYWVQVMDPEGNWRDFEPWDLYGNACAHVRSLHNNRSGRHNSMSILRRLTVPTGDILVVEGSQGPLEMLSLADYGQHVNLNQHKSVPDGLPLLPLTEKWVLTISTQYGCSSGCTFCDVPKVGPGRNASYDDLMSQVDAGLALHPEVKESKRLNIHFARMGEPTWNPHVIECAEALAPNEVWWNRYNVHPVVSTMMPRRNDWLRRFLRLWVDLKNDVYDGNAGLQISVNSTDEEERQKMFSGSALTLAEIADMMTYCWEPRGRKFTLNFAVADYTVDPEVLLQFFPPEYYVCKLTPMHKTHRALRNGIKTEGDYTTPGPYLDLERRLREAGYDVLVFIASRDEDESRITCGNAILSGTLPHKFTEVSP